jgi:hypothetical protein
MINLLTIHVKKVTIQVKNMQLLNQLRENIVKSIDDKTHSSIA